MNRRHFLQSLLAVPALTLALVKKPEAALCKCGKPMPANPKRLTPEDFQARYIRPAVAAMAAQIDAECLAMMSAPGYGYALNEGRKAIELTPQHHDQLFIASGGQGYILSLRGGQRAGKQFQFSELSVAEAW